MDCKALLINHLLISANFHFLLFWFLQLLKCFTRLRIKFNLLFHVGHLFYYQTTFSAQSSNL
uniref:Uncharacterized protein n=1 Tax=Mus spicilegus TaxID=10103 RepID=A0A8C6IBV4_MUSSI